MISYTVELSAAAELDIYFAKTWYESHSLQVAIKFLDKIDLAFQNIRSNPFAFSKLTPKSRYRKYRTPGFPYRIYYFVIESVIQIMAVVHSRRSDKFVRQRLK